jgi:LmbE family N-acetylglucosaminyl deacetylase
MTDRFSYADLVAPSRHIFISPHYDDIALSCGGTAALTSGAGKDSIVVLVFGDHPDPDVPLTPFARHLHEQWGLDADQVIASRRAEEDLAAQRLGLRTRFLPFKDAIYRGERYLSDNDLFGEPARDEGRLPHEIASAVEFESGKDAEARIYAPLGIGNHVDHQLCYRAGVELARKGREVFFYEDLPYALIPGRATQRLDGVAEPLEIAAIADVTEVWQSKVEAIMAYPSQLGVIFEEYVGTGSSRDDIDQATAAYSRTVGEGVLAERFWRLGD